MDSECGDIDLDKVMILIETEPFEPTHVAPRHKDDRTKEPKGKE